NLRFWLNKGVDGFRFDAVGVLFENGSSAWNNQPENHVLLKEVQDLVDFYGKRFMICEAPDDPPAFAAATSCGRAFAFGTQGAILDSARNFATDGSVTNRLAAADVDRLPLFLSNHDSFAGDRVWNQLNGDTEQYKLAAATYLLASRNPFTYYGEEVGMANASVYTDDRTLRTPMSWTSNTVTAGFTTGTPFRNLSDNVATQNVADEEGDSDSLLENYRSLYQLRATYPLIASGAMTLQSGSGDPVLLWTRSDGGIVAIIAINFAATGQQVTADTGLVNTTFDAVLGATGQLGSDASGMLTIAVPGRTAVVFVNP
ncbi:MAG: glycosidase, partial [Chromatiales bacterium]